MIAQLEGGALGGLAVADILFGTADIDGIERAQTSAVGVVCAGIDSAFNAGVSIRIVLHTIIPPSNYILSGDNFSMDGKGWNM